jgi:UDP-glucose 4-epimerase
VAKAEVERMSGDGVFPEKWLITGGCGFIGSVLLKKLEQENCRARVVDNLSVGIEEALPGRAWTRRSVYEIDSGWPGRELIVADIVDADVAVAVSRDADVIVHLAANTGVAPSVANPRMDCNINVIGTLNYLEAARVNRIPRFVFASSGAPLGRVDPPVTEDKPARPMSPYGASKLAGEGYCSAYFCSFGIDTVALRFGNVFGPGSNRKQSVVAKFVRRALDGDLLEVYGDGQQTRDFIFVDDIADAIIRAAYFPNIGGEIFQIASNRERSVNEVAGAVADLVQHHTGQPVRLSYAQALPYEMKRNYSDISKARRLLDFEPRTDFKSGLTLTLQYFLEEHVIAKQ